jgi:hypothetical protein
MFSSTALLLAFTAWGYASPIVYRQEASPFVFTNSNGLNFTQMNTTLPNITIFATGKRTVTHSDLQEILLIQTQEVLLQDPAPVIRQQQGIQPVLWEFSLFSTLSQKF